MIVFENDGELDVRAIKTFGVNSKDKSDAIGYFGTGLKYAIAIFLRTGHTVNIISGENVYKFDINVSKIRNDEFDIVTMNGEDLAYTTELGKDWKTWMAFRELYSNMLDEEGVAYETDIIGSSLSDSKTYVCIDGPETEKLWADRETIFFNSQRKTIAKNTSVSVYALSAFTGSIYLKGVRVFTPRQLTMHDYNFKFGLTIQEDRSSTDTWSMHYRLAELVTGSKDKKFITRMVMPIEDAWEWNISYNYNTADDCEVFLDVIGDLRKKFKEKGIVESAIKLHKDRRKVQTVMPGISCYLNKVQTKQLDRATQFCKKTLELDIDQYKLIVCKDLGDPTQLGEADMDEGVMYIAKTAFEGGTKQVAISILEEFTHCEHRVEDETIDQKWVYLRQIVSLGERITGDPL